MDKWNVTGIYTPIKRNEVYIDRCSNMDEPWNMLNERSQSQKTPYNTILKHAKWKKPVTKDSIQYDFIHTKYPEQAIYREKCISMSRI